MNSVTIIIPHKNSPKLLERCLASIPKREDIQIIIVDDNSDPAIVDFENFPGKEQSNVKVIETKEGKGAGYARNIGLKHACSKWVLFADADDYFTDQLDGCLDHYMDSDFDYIILNIETEKGVDASKDRGLYITGILNQNTSLIDKVIRLHTPTIKLLKYEFLKEKNITFEEVRYSNDVMFSVKTAIEATSIHIDTNYKIYTISFTEGSLTNQINSSSFRCRLDVCFRCYKYLKSKGKPEYMWQINKPYLFKAGKFSSWEVIRTFVLLVKNGLFFYGKEIPVNGYYNTPLYMLFYAMFKIKRTKF